MKEKLPFITLSVFVAMIVCTVTSFLNLSNWAKGSLNLLTLFFTATAIILWIKILRSLDAKVNLILGNTPEKSQFPWSLKRHTDIFRGLELLDSRVKTSTKRILQLTAPDKMEWAGNTTSSDPLSTAIIQVRREMEKIKAEDVRRSWIDNGISKFATILSDRAEQKEYCYNIVNNLVKYLNANQGGFYLEKNIDGERVLELVACYAYSKKRYVENRITEGQGLLGQCMLEKDFVYLTEIPKDFIKITSGLGEATPRCITIAPLVFNGKFVGAIELASFHLIQPHQMEFLKKVCDNIASQIATLDNVVQTQALLEASNKLTVELQSREEEMRQNMEELVATQEAMERKQLELSGIINAIDATLGTVELSSAGNINKANGILLKMLKCSERQLIKVDYKLLVGDASVSWNSIFSGIVKHGEYKTANFDGDELWLSITFTVFTTNNASNESNVLCLVQDITEKKLWEQEIERLSLVANNTDNSVIITNGDGLIEYVNDGFSRMTGYSFEEVNGKKPGLLLQGPLTNRDTVKRLSESITSGKPVYEEILNYHKDGHHYWVSLVINPIKDGSGQISKFISIQADITKTKIEALDFHQKMDALSRSNAIIELDKEGTVIHANENYLRMTGFSANELLGKSYSTLNKTELQFSELTRRVAQNGFFTNVVERADKSGNQLFIKVMDYPVLDFNGEIEKIIEFDVDVTKEKALEVESARKQRELDSYLQGINNTVASAEFDSSGNFLAANQIFLKIMGYKEDEVTGVGFHTLMGDDPAVVMMWENLRLGKFFSGEFKMKSRSGGDLWLNGTFNPILIDGTSPAKIIMFAQFTTQEKEKVNDLNAFVHALKSSLPVLEYTADFKCKTANEKALKIFGVSRLMLKSKTVLDFIAPFYHNEWSKMIPNFAEGECTQLILPFVTSESIVNFEVCISVSKTLDGRIAKVVMILIKEVQDRISVLAVG